ncbi:MAG: hypothetical protein KF750_14340, partial [Xanthobacteraceae bacterium]|nr:hypothetical protein [Xanthobacteraceae bacterium]
LALHNSIYQPLTDEDVANGVNLTIRVNESVRVGSENTALHSIDFGDGDDWPEGFDITLEVQGLIAGKGADGCGPHTMAAYAVYTPGWPPGPGGPALRTRFPIKVRVKPGGKIGGGGGAGGPSAVYSGGSSGTGSVPGAGAGVDPGLGAVAYGGNNADALNGSDAVPRSGQLLSGKGGDLGEDGESGTSFPGYQAYNKIAGSAAGAAIDGISFCTILEGDADILGPRIN